MANSKKYSSHLTTASKTANLTKITLFYVLSLRKSIFVVLPIIVIFSVPTVSHASVWSFLTDIFTNSASAQSEASIQSSVESATDTNSQNIQLLQAPNSPDPLGAKIATDVSITGNEALLPEVSPSNEAPDIIDNSNSQINTYVVHKGDTVGAIAKMYDVSSNTILWANDLKKGSALKEGQTLVILPISGVIHTVVKGDTLKSIAKKYAADVDGIAQFNDMKTTDGLSVGDQLIIPDGEMANIGVAVNNGLPTVSTKTTEKYIKSASGPEYPGYYMKPFVGGHKTQGLHGYNAVDYGMPVGSPLFAAAMGKVIIAKNNDKYNGGYGNYVAIQHPNGTQTLYGHMSDVIVSVGDTVVQGQMIGYSGNTGKSTGPHLHFEVRGAKNPF